MDWPFLFPPWSILRKEQYSYHCVRFWASAYHLVLLLLWFAVTCLHVSRLVKSYTFSLLKKKKGDRMLNYALLVFPCSGSLLLFQQSVWCQNIHHHVWCHQHVLLCCHGKNCGITFTIVRLLLVLYTNGYIDINPFPHRCVWCWSWPLSCVFCPELVYLRCWLRTWRTLI